MNERHPLDILSLIFGVLFIGISLPVLLIDTPVNLEVRWILPAVVIVVGLTVLWSALRPRVPAGSDGSAPPGDDV